MKLVLKQNCFSPLFFPLLLDYTTRWLVLNGSAGSGKTYFIQQRCIYRCLKESGCRVMICRRYASTIRQTVFENAKCILRQWKLLNVVQINESDFRMKFPNGSEIIFVGLDDEQKILSLANIDVIVIDEATEVPKNIVEQVNLRLRGKERQQIILCFNPISKNHWLFQFCEGKDRPDSFKYLKSTYKDNPFLDSEYIRQLEDLRRTNPAKARVFCNGEWGVNPDGLVFQNWTIQEFDPMELAAKGFEHRCGADLGYIDASTIIDTLYDRDNKTIYVINEWYKTGCQPDEIAQAAIDMHLQRTKIYFDSAEPRSIQFFRQAGLNAVGSIKGADSVNSGYSFLQMQKIVVLPKCKHLIADLENLSYLKDKQTDTYTNKMTHEWSHAIDGLRYAYCDIYTHTKLQTISKDSLGIW